MEQIIVGIAEGKTALANQILISYALGSCVGVCLYDAGKHIAGMAHIVLPSRHDAAKKENAYKFADEGIHALLKEMIVRGAHQSRMTAKISGGAKMFKTQGKEWEIGQQNVEAVKETLKKEGIRIIGEDTGKNYGRTILFSADSGQLEVRTVRHTSVVL